MDLMNAPRYLRRNEQDGSILDSARRAHKAPEMQVPFDVEKGKHRPLCHLIVQEINLIRNDIERALREETQKGIEKQKTVMEVQTWAEMADDAKAQAELALKEIKENIARISKNEH